MEKLDTDLLKYCTENELAVNEIGQIGLQIIRGVQVTHSLTLLLIHSLTHSLTSVDSPTRIAVY